MVPRCEQARAVPLCTIYVEAVSATVLLIASMVVAATHHQRTASDTVNDACTPRAEDTVIFFPTLVCLKSFEPCLHVTVPVRPIAVCPQNQTRN